MSKVSMLLLKKETRENVVVKKYRSSTRFLDQLLAVQHRKMLSTNFLVFAC